MKVIANNALCSGHARCAAVSPQVFALDEHGYIAFAEKIVPADEVDAARRGVRACPERALSLAEDPASPTSV